MNKFFISTILEEDEQIKPFLAKYQKRNRNFFINTLSERFSGEFDIEDRINYYTVKDIKLGWNGLEEKPDKPIIYYLPYFLLLNLQHTKKDDVIAYMYYKDIDELKNNLIYLIDNGLKDINVVGSKDKDDDLYFDPRFIVIKNTIPTKAFLEKVVVNNTGKWLNRLITEDKELYAIIK